MIGIYHIHYIAEIESNIPNWHDPVWDRAEIADIAQFHPKSSEHSPLSQVKIVYNDKGIFLLFRVMDRYVLSRHTEYNAKVHEDSCVEWFFSPPGAVGYYNFEMNAGGTLHVNYIIDPLRDENGKRKDVRPIPQEIAEKIEIQSTLPKVVDPEICDPIEWRLAMHIPFSFFDHISPVKDLRGSAARGNLYKCADKTSHPHWAAWNAIKELNFHQPARFGIFIFKE